MTEVHTRKPAKGLIYSLVADVVAVLIFALSGRSSHQESLTALGVLETAWPFLSALAIGWLVSRIWRSPLALWPQAICLWLITVAGGMALRIAAGGTAAFAFVVVAALVLGAFLLGHRIVAQRVMSRTRQS